MDKLFLLVRHNISMKKRLPNEQFRKLVEFINETRKDKSKKIYEDKEPREIDWFAYNQSQINDSKETLIFIKEAVDKCIDPPKKVGRPLTNPKELAKAILVCELFGLVERKAQGFLELFGGTVGIVEKLDDRTIGDAYDKKEVAFILRQVFEMTKDSDRILSGDGTGLETSRRQNYENDRTTIKEFLTSIVDSREIIQAFDFSGEDECRAMHSLIEEVEGESLRLDAGFNDRKLVRKIVEFGMLPYVYPYKSNKLNGDECWKEMYFEFLIDIIEWLGEYYQRVHCESFHSSFKRVFGIIRKVRGHSKFIQVMARIILHNRARLSYFKRIRS
jgi:transposase